jgi:hypothetical protein
MGVMIAMYTFVRRRNEARVEVPLEDLADPSDPGGSGSGAAGALIDLLFPDYSQWKLRWQLIYWGQCLSFSYGVMFAVIRAFGWH